jgi:hypothetical protein
MMRLRRYTRSNKYGADSGSLMFSLVQLSPQILELCIVAHTIFSYSIVVTDPRFYLPYSSRTNVIYQLACCTMTMKCEARHWSGASQAVASSEFPGDEITLDPGRFRFTPVPTSITKTPPLRFISIDAGH